MGAYSFSIPVELLELAKELLGCELFVETGTFHGESSVRAAQVFPRVMTCEKTEEIRALAQKSFTAIPNIQSFLGDSAEFLGAQRHAYAEKPTCFWLDAHWCASSIEVGAGGQTRLLAELEALGTLNDRSAIFIDDARYYLGPPKPPNQWRDWPDIAAVVDALRATSSNHALVVYNDVLCFVPKEHKTRFVERLFPTWVDPAETTRTIQTLAAKLLEKYGRSPTALVHRLLGRR
jgi:hypothetical protein